MELSDPLGGGYWRLRVRSIIQYRHEGILIWFNESHFHSYPFARVMLYSKQLSDQMMIMAN